MTLSAPPTDSPLTLVPPDYYPAGSDRWFTIPGGKDAGKVMFYSDHIVGDDEPDATIVFVHGNPETSYTYRHIRDALIDSNQSMRLIAMDHIGFGLSDQADFEMVDMHHADNLIQLIRHLDLINVTLVVHDWGGPIGIGAFIEDPYRLRNLVVLNSTIFPMPRSGFTYQNYPNPVLPWSLYPRIYPAFAWGGIAATAVTNGEPQSILSLISRAMRYTALHLLRRLPRNTPEYVWSQSLRSVRNARSSMRNVMQTSRWGYGYSYRDPVYGKQSNREFYRQMQEKLPKIWRDIPAAGFFGQWDPCGKDEVIDQWHNAMPEMKRATYRFPGVGHFIEEYKGDEIAQAILTLISPQA